MTTKTNNAPKLANATKAPVATKAPAKTSPAKAPTCKAPVKQAPSNEAIIMDTLRKLNARVDTLETANSLNEVRITEAFENMTKVIASLQVTLANMGTVKAPATTAPATTAKAPKQAPATRDNGERGTYDGPDVSGPADDVLAYLAECVIENSTAGFLNENVAKASPNSYRRYLRTAQNKAFKACREAHDLTLTQLDDAFTALFA